MWLWWGSEGHSAGSWQEPRLKGALCVLLRGVHFILGGIRGDWTTLGRGMAQSDLPFRTFTLAAEKGLQEVRMKAGRPVWRVLQSQN